MRSALTLFFLVFASSVHSLPAARARTELHPITLRSGTTLNVQIQVPDHVPSDKKLPAFLVFGGFETGGRVLSLLQTPEPVILVNFDYPYEGRRRIRFFEVIREARKIRKALRDTEEGILKTVDQVRHHPRIHPERIGIVGASFGAPLAVFAASRSEHLRGLVIVHGFADLGFVIEHRLKQIWARRGYPEFLVRAAAFLASRIAVKILNPPEPSLYGPLLRADQNVFLIEPETDFFIPEKSRQALREALKKSQAPVHSVTTSGDHLQPGSTEMIQDIINQTTLHFKTLGWFTGS